jgi:hypothetical protein
MRFRAELSRQAKKQRSRFPRQSRERIERAIDEFEEKDDSQWSNIKALQGAQWKRRLPKTVGPSGGAGDEWVRRKGRGAPLMPGSKKPKVSRRAHRKAISKRS